MEGRKGERERKRERAGEEETNGAGRTRDRKRAATTEEEEEEEEEEKERSASRGWRGRALKRRGSVMDAEITIEVRARRRYVTKARLTPATDWSAG